MTPPRKKLSITLPPDLAARADAASRGNLSDFMTKAVQAKLLADAMEEYQRLRGLDPIDDVSDAIEADAA